VATRTNSSTRLDLGAVPLVLVEDDRLLSDLLATALRDRFNAGRMKVFTHGRAALEHCLEEPPDLLVTDLALPDMNGRELIRTMRERWPDLRVIVMTGQVNPALPGELLTLGAAGFVHKTSSFDELEFAIRRVLENQIYISAGLNLEIPQRHATRPPAGGPPPSVLTEREREIARLVASGLISKEIAGRLGLSPRTIEKARAHILAKLGLRDLPSLVRWCLNHDLL
jgi:DNA-binding NarL/FixJ family response regulator